MSKADSEGVEELISVLKDFVFTWKDNRLPIITDYNIQAIETILKELKRLQEENTEYKKQLDLDYVRENYIPKYKIREKIEEHNK